MNNVKCFIVIVVIIIIFTYLFKRAHDPLTQTHVYYYDTTIENDVDVTQKILDSYYFYNIYTIYIIKCREIPKFSSSYLLTPLIYKTNGYYYFILLGYRYRIKTLTDVENQITILITDNLVRVPFFSPLWSYHPFAITISRGKEIVDLTTKIPTIVCHPSFNGIETYNKLSVSYHSFVQIYNKLFKEYHITFD